jgi:glutaredoxin 2
MAKNSKIHVRGSDISIVQNNAQDYISLTDIAKHKTNDSSAVIANWMRNRNTIEYLGVWETLYNPDFKPLEFEGFKTQAGLNAFTLSPQKSINAMLIHQGLNQSQRIAQLNAMAITQMKSLLKLDNTQKKLGASDD